MGRGSRQTWADDRSWQSSGSYQLWRGARSPQAKTQPWRKGGSQDQNTAKGSKQKAFPAYDSMDVAPGAPCEFPSAATSDRDGRGLRASNGTEGLEFYKKMRAQIAAFAHRQKEIGPAMGCVRPRAQASISRTTPATCTSARDLRGRHLCGPKGTRRSESHVTADCTRRTASPSHGRGDQRRRSGVGIPGDRLESGEGRQRGRCSEEGAYGGHQRPHPPETYTGAPRGHQPMSGRRKPGERRPQLLLR